MIVSNCWSTMSSKNYTFLILFFLAISIISCKEDCEKNYGKESFYIETSLEVIDSIEITNKRL